MDSPRAAWESSRPGNWLPPELMIQEAVSVELSSPL